MANLYRFDGFNCWGRHEGLPESVIAFLEREYPDAITGYAPGILDPWFRGVLGLSDEKAQELKKIVEEWNYDEDGYHAYQISFHPASGTEHQIRLNAGTYKATDSWQWMR